MEEFLKNNYSLLTKSVEFIAAITAIIVCKKYKHTVVKYFCWFLIYVFFVELIGGYTVYLAKFPALSHIKEALQGTLVQRNYWWYNMFWGIGGILFYSTYFLTIVRNKKFKLMISSGRALFLVLAIGYIICNIDEYFASSITFNYIIGAILILISSSLYFIDLLKSDRLLSFYKSVNFYVAAVILIWYLAVTPLTFYQIYFSTADWDYVILRMAIMLSMNIFMYLTFTFALLWCKPQNV